MKYQNLKLTPVKILCKWKQASAVSPLFTMY